MIKKLTDIVGNYVASQNETEELQYANRLTITGTYPLLLSAAVINLVIFTFIGRFGAEVIINSICLLLFAVALFITDKLFRSESSKYVVIIIIFSLGLIFIVWRYYTQVGPAVWTIAMINVMISVLRNNRFMMAVLSMTLFLLGLYVWALNIQFEFGTAYYLVQFAAFFLLFAVTGGIQTINSVRYKKLKYYLTESEMITEITADFISVSVDNLDDKVRFMLGKSARYLNVDFATIFLLSEDRQKLTYTYDWFAEGPKVPMGTVSYDLHSRPDWVDLLENRTVRMIEDVNNMEPASIGKRELQAMNIRSLISMPIIVKGQNFGILFYGTHGNICKWQPEQKKMLVVLTNLLGDAFSKVASEKEVNHMAYYDTLTGLPNRHYFNSRLDDAIQVASDLDRRLAVIFVDLDGFKSVNDTIGHEGGDELLQHMSRNLIAYIGDDGIVGRLGGDEFIVLLSDLDKMADLRLFVDNMMTVFTQPISVENQEFYLTASAGIALYPIDGTDARSLKRNADMAMYVAKELGKNQAYFCTPELKEEVEKKARLTNLLHRALARRELVVYYQPLIDIKTSEIVGVEALLRWNQRELGMISPGVFIPLAEQTGQIYPIGQWVLETACRQSKAWQDMGLRPVRMAVNISIEQFRRTDVIDMVKDTLERSELPPEYLELEITESVAIKETDYIRDKLEALRDLGVSISIDDFGTEYSSLSRIKRLPIDRVKMSMEFVHGISVSDKDEAIAKTIINLANNLGLKVIAEGVETGPQYSFLKAHACDEIQGYFFHKPMMAADMERLLRQL